MGHQGSYERKVQAVENLDERVIKRLTDALDAQNMEYRMLVLPDHPTPVRVRTHTSENVPYLLFDSTDKKNETWNYNEKDAAASGMLIEEGYTDIQEFYQDNL